MQNASAEFAAISLSDGACYLGYWVGPQGTQPAWQQPLAKVQSCAVVLTSLAFGAPAAMMVAKQVIWSCIAHLLSVYTAPTMASNVCSAVSRELFKRAPAWLPTNVPWHVNLLGVPAPALYLPEMSFRARLALVLRL